MKYLNLILKSIILIYSIYLIKTLLTVNNTMGVERHLMYESGYIRRGLVGEIFFLLVKYFSFSIDVINFYSSLLIKIGVLIIVSSIVYLKKINFFLIFSAPLMIAGITFSAAPEWIFGNLDFLLLLIFLLQVIIYRKNKNFIVYLFFSVIGIMIHELYFFLTVIPSFFLLRQEKREKIIYYILICSLFILQGINKGDASQVQEINKQWNNIGVYDININVLKGLVSNSGLNFWWVVNKTLNQKIGFILNNLVIIFFIALLNYNKKNSRTETSYFFILLCIQNIVFFSLSMIANDFGRWYFLLFTSITLFYYLEKDNIFFKRSNYLEFLPKALEKLNIYKYIIYFFVGVPFGNWSFHQFIHSLPYQNMAEIIRSFL